MPSRARAARRAYWVSGNMDIDGHSSTKMWFRRRQVREKVCFVVGGRWSKIMRSSSVGREGREGSEVAIMVVNRYG